MNPTNRTRTHCVLGVGILLIALLLSVTSSALAQALLDPVAHPKFVNPLPVPARLDLTAGGNFTFEMRETMQSYGLVDAAGMPLLTTVWGYGQPDDVLGGHPITSPGPTLEAMRDMPVNIKWMNRLPRHYNYPYGPNPHLLAGLSGSTVKA